MAKHAARSSERIVGSDMDASEAASQIKPTQWKSLDSFRLMDSRGLSGCVPYLDGLIIKLEQFDYHLELLTEAATNCVKETRRGSVTGDWVQAAVFKMEAQVEAAMHAAYSAVDMLGQAINFMVPEIRIPEEHASFAGVKSALEKVTTARDIYHAVKALDESAEFAYFHAFANTSKHRRPVRTTVEIKEQDAVNALLEVHIQEISGRKGDFPPRPFSHIVLVTEPGLRGRIGDVLIATGAYVATLPAIA